MTKYNYGFIADAFKHQYEGGAEKTTHAIIEACPSPRDAWMANPNQITKQNLEELFREDLIKKRKTRFIFGNFASLDGNMLPAIITNFEYFIIEYDYKFCVARSPEKHEAVSGAPCNCHAETIGQVISTFYSKAQHVFFMSESQRNVYREKFPQWDIDSNSSVLSSIFSKEDWLTIEQAREISKKTHRKDRWIFQNSDSWIKNTDGCREWAKENSKDGLCSFKDMSAFEVMCAFGESKGFVFLPLGSDTCPRTVIEAKLMGCELHLNENAHGVNEAWFTEGTIDTIEEYLKSRPEHFWSIVSAS
jgi:hypothetical protein